MNAIKTHQWFAGFDWGGVQAGEYFNQVINQASSIVKEGFTCETLVMVGNGHIGNRFFFRGTDRFAVPKFTGVAATAVRTWNLTIPSQAKHKQLPQLLNFVSSYLP